MDLRGLASNIYDAAVNIDSGRKGFAIRGKEQEGRISYELGIDSAMTSFREAQYSADPHLSGIGDASLKWRPTPLADNKNYLSVYPCSVL